MAAGHGSFPEYKPSGVEWLGQVPAHWSVKKLRHFADVLRGKFTHRPRNDPAFYDGPFPFVQTGDITGASKYISEFHQTLNARGVSVSKEFPKGTLVMAIAANIGDVAILKFPAYFPDSVGGLLPNRASNVMFLYYMMQAMKQPLIQRATISTQMNLNIDQICWLSAACPPLDEQTQIAKFLDYETARIDALIEKQQQLIALLQEKRQAVISHAVTKGLNPDVSMRDSGVEWLGKVPAHWGVKRLKHVSPRVGVGLVINPSTYTRDEGVYFIFGGDVKEHCFDLSSTRRMRREDSDRLTPSRLNAGDLLSVRVGDPGVTAVVTPELEGANCASVIIIRRGAFSSDWLCSAMNSWVGRQQVGLVSYGAAQKQFNVSDAVEFVFPVPPQRRARCNCAVHCSEVRALRPVDGAGPQRRRPPHRTPRRPHLRRSHRQNRRPQLDPTDI